MTTPTQRKEDKELLEKITAKNQPIHPLLREGNLILPGSPKHNNIIRLHESGFIIPRQEHYLFNLRNAAIEPSQFILTKSGEEYLEQLSNPAPNPQKNLRAFITHGKDHSFIDPAKKVCQALGFEPESSIQAPNENQTVFEKVIAGINQADVVIVFLTNDNGAGKASENAISELHTAKAQGKHTIVFKEKDVEMPSNLHGIAYSTLGRAMDDNPPPRTARIQEKVGG